MDAYYPVFLNISGRLCVVVGGGKVAERKTVDLLKAGARVLVVSPKITARLQREISKGTIKHKARRLKACDWEDAFLVVAATDDERENRKVAGVARLVNVVDRPELCTFIVPSVVRRGPLAIAVSTSGASPALAREIRKDIENTYGDAFAKYLDSIKRARKGVISEIQNPAKRRRYLKSLASPKIIQTLKKGKVPDIKTP